MKIRCLECNWHGNDSQLVSGHPLMDEDCCPRCFTADHLRFVHSPAPRPEQIQQHPADTHRAS